MKTTFLSSFALSAVLLTAANVSHAQTSYPMLMSLRPVAAQAGQTSEHTINSRYSMYGAYQVLVTGEGVTGEVIPPDAKPDDKGKEPNVTNLKVRFTVAPDAQPGVRDFRLATPRGASTLGQLVIVREPVVAEADKNDSAEQAQAVTVPCTLCGAIERAEDVDFFKFNVPAGAEFNFHVRSMRLQDRIHDLQQHVDPILTLRNASGTTIAASDNFFFGDPFLSYRFEQAGDYLLEIRDVRYQGNADWVYSIEVSSRPLVTNVHPTGLTRGRETGLRLIGSGLPGNAAATLALSADAPLGLRRMQLPLGDVPSNPVAVFVSDAPQVVEVDGDNNTPAAATVVAVPCGISGRIEADNDVDHWAFEAKKGERFTFELFARRLQSPLDSYLRVVNADGGQLALNDDLRIGKRGYSDSRIEDWTAPADGRFALEVRDLHLRGGEGFVYFIAARRARPYFGLFLDTDKTQLTPGTCGVLFARVERKEGFDGEIQLQIEGLPPGVTATCGRILAGKGQDGCIVLQADAGAAQAAANITVTGTATVEVDGKPETLRTTAVPYQEIYQPGGGRGHWPADMHTVCVGTPNDLRAIQLSTTEVTLRPGESQRIDVKLQRAEGFNQNVTLDVQFQHLGGIFGSSLPPGVSLDAKNSQTLLTGDKSDGYITLTAAADAQPVEKQVIAVMANIAINFVMKATYSGPPITVTVTK